MEAILEIGIALPPQTQVMIFKKSDNKWWRVGTFSLWYMWEEDKAEHMLELRNIIDLDHKDVIIRLTAGGTDIQKETELSIYRLYKGRLYRTFETTEEFALRRFPSPGLMMIEDVRSQISYPEVDRREGAYIVERIFKQSVPQFKVGPH